MASPYEVAQLKKRIEELEDKVSQYEDCKSGPLCDDMFEYLVVARPEAMKNKIQDILDYKAESYRRIPEKDRIMKQILMFFDGPTIRIKKEALREYLKENPIFRSVKPELLLQRLRLARKYGTSFEQREIPQAPIQDAIDDLNATPEEPKDEDFLT